MTPVVAVGLYDTILFGSFILAIILIATLINAELHHHMDVLLEHRHNLLEDALTHGLTSRQIATERALFQVWRK